LHACLLAVDQLALDGIRARVIDLYSIKPVDSETLVVAADATEGRIVGRRGTAAALTLVDQR
jgi:transketolase